MKSLNYYPSMVTCFQRRRLEGFMFRGTIDRFIQGLTLCPEIAFTTVQGIYIILIVDTDKRLGCKSKKLNKTIRFSFSHK